MNDPTPEEGQICFIILKPDAIERGIVGKIISRIEDAYLRVQGIQQRHKSEKWVREHYKHITDDDILTPLIEFMTAVPLIGFVASGPHAIARMNKMAGSTDSTVALPGTIRGDFGNYPIRFNLIHTSDSPEATNREMELFYNPLFDQG